MKTLNKPGNFLGVCLLVLSLSCKTVDIRPDYALKNQTENDFEKGRRLLQETYEKMGYDRLAQTETYKVDALFKWKTTWSMMPLNALPGNKGNDLTFKFATGTFDGSAEFLEGRKKGKIYGIQSWQTYLKKQDESPEKVSSKRYSWGLATYHYVIEAPMRLLDAEIIRYAGEKAFNGKQYDLVYVTWGKDKPHKEHDQWLVYINKETGFTDLTEITINDFFLPMPEGMKGATIQTERSEAKNGTFLPSLVTIQLGKPKKKSRHVYTFQLDDYQFNSFPLEELQPFKDLPQIGDSKEQTHIVKNSSK